MNGPTPLKTGFVGEARHTRIGIDGKLSLGSYEIEAAEEFVGDIKFRNTRTNLVGKLDEEADDFATFVDFEFARMIAELDNLGGLDEDGFAGCALIVDNAGDCTFVHRSDRDDKASVAHRRRSIAVENTVGNTLRHDFAHGRRYSARYCSHLASNAGEFRRRIVADIAAVVDYGGNGADNFGSRLKL